MTTANLVQAEEDGGPAMMMASIEIVQEGITPPATTTLAHIESVQEAQIFPMGSTSTMVHHSQEAYRLGGDEETVMGWQGLNRNTSDPDLLGTIGTMWEAWNSPVVDSPIIMLASVKFVQEAQSSLVDHTLTTASSGQSSACRRARHGWSIKVRP